MVLARGRRPRWMQIDNVYDEVVRVDYFDTQRLCHVGREVLRIARNVSGASANDGSART